MQVLAIGVLVDFMKDLDRAKTYATQCDEKPVWSKLGKAVPFPETETETETETAQARTDVWCVFLFQTERERTHFLILPGV